METVDRWLTERERSREQSVNRAIVRPLDARDLEPAMSSRLEDVKFLLTLSAVVLFGSGLDVILR